MARRKTNPEECAEMRILQVRLKQARQREKLSMEELVAKMGKDAISKQSISKFENGITYPTSHTLYALAKALNVTTDYFFRPLTYDMDNASISFRAKSTMSAKEVKSLSVKIQEAVERNLEIDAVMNSTGKPVNLPKIEKTLCTKQDMLELAEMTRKTWNLGVAPISNVKELLKSLGIKVFEVEGAAGFDGVSGKVDDSTWFIVLNTAVENVERKRLTLLHELCHLIANEHFDPEMTDYTKESMCNVFAGAMLLPGVARTQLYDHKNAVTVASLAYGQETYGISPDAIMKTLNNAEIINDERYRQYNIRKNMSAELKIKLTQSRFVESGGAESDVFRAKVYMALAKGYIDEAKAADLMQCGIDEVKRNNEQV